jgi:hypothetical protein
MWLSTALVVQTIISYEQPNFFDRKRDPNYNCCKDLSKNAML